MKLLISNVLLSFLYYTESYRILVCYPFPVKSLSILGAATVKYLLNDGHEVTYITSFPLNKPDSKSFRQIDIGNSDTFETDFSNLEIFLKNKVTSIDVQETHEIVRDNVNFFFQNSKVLKLLEDPTEHFDAVVVDLVDAPIYSGLALLYDCPMIWLYSMGAHWHVLRLIADPSNPAYDGDYLGTNIPPFSFKQRLEELWARVKWSYSQSYILSPIEQKIYKELFGELLAKKGRVLPDYTDVIYNSSLIFGNEHNAVGFKPSTPQNFKYIGGFHIEDPVKPLPKDLQNLMDNAPHGVIYFSMGSFFKSKTWPKEMIRSLLNVFGELEQTVVWKFEEKLPDLPANVHIVHWAPQPSILAHPNCKIFITHGGLLSSIETVHFGIPIIGIPIWFDQNINMIRAQASGYALRVPFNYDIAQNLKSAVNAMLSDEKYAKRAKELSAIYHDRPIKPGAELVHWVNHVISTGGALHLRSPAVNVPLYQRLYLDLIFTLIGILIITYIIFWMAIRKIKKNNTLKKKQ